MKVSTKGFPLKFQVSRGEKIIFIHVKITYPLGHPVDDPLPSEIIIGFMRKLFSGTDAEQQF